MSVPSVPDLLRDPSGRRVVVVGAGVQGLSAGRLLKKLGAEVAVADDAPEAALAARLAERDLADAELRAGGVTPAVVEDADLVVLSAGFPRRHEAVQAALKNHTPVVGEVEVGAAHLGRAAIAGITGTNGKSTVTTMLGAIARSFQPDAFEGGNLGTPLCDVVHDGGRPTLCALELSSYQLETARHLSLTAAVVTNLSPDHLDRYNSVEDYYAAKANILDLVREGGAACLNRADRLTRKHLVDRRPGRAFDFAVVPGGEGVAIDAGALEVRVGGDRVRVPLDNPRIVGDHSAQNAAAAVAAAAVLGVPPEHWEKGLSGWGGIAHRLERLGEAGGVVWFNDSKATNVEAATTAVLSFRSGVHLIAGGKGKGSSYEPLAAASRGRVARLYAIGEDGPAIAEAFAGVAPVDEAGDLDTAVAHALDQARPGDVLLLSPACASFDQFPDFRARGDALRALFSKAGGTS